MYFNDDIRLPLRCSYFFQIHFKKQEPVTYLYCSFCPKKSLMIIYHVLTK